MKYEYEIYTCNNGNPTAIITDTKDEKLNNEIAEKIYEIHPDVDQVAVFLNKEENNYRFQLVNGEFCGNACLSISAYIYEKYKIKDSTIINKIINENTEEEYIEIKSKYNGKIGNLLIPKKLFLTKEKYSNKDGYLVKMNGITHMIISQSFGKENEEYAKKQIEKLSKNNIDPDVLGIIFLDNNTIDPFIWIKRIPLLQHQESCLSGSIAAAEYLQQKETTNTSRIIQPTGEYYDIKFLEDFIDITGTVRKYKSGNVEVE